ncbi:hypothetical protein SERLA73DRAFT_44073, partial [Serpula lacrymans var. lacrymans S7.3]
TRKNFVCTVNVLHDCITANCSNTAMVPVYQEYSETTKITQVVVHKQFNQYFLNVYSLHNCKHIYLVVPSQLCTKTPRVNNVEEV